MRANLQVRAFLIAMTCVSQICMGTSLAGDDKESPALSDLAWMTGSWLERKEGVETEEHWIAPKGEVMLGLNRMVRPDGRSSFEFLRIARTTTGVSYFASPQGRPATEFALSSVEDKKAVFENPKHDFPQRIVYWLERDGTLHARIEGTIKGQKRSHEWRWEKAP